MKNVFLATVFFMLFCSCNTSSIRKSFSTSDSLVIYFKNEQAGIVTKTVQTADKKAISRMIDFIDKKETENYKCGYDGKMFFFFEGNKIQEVDFKMSDLACNHFSFLIGEKLISTKMNDEAIDFLDALEKGMPYYY